MVKFPGEPVVLCMTRAAFFLKLTFVNIFMAVNAFFRFGSILLILVALFTLHTLMFANQRKLRLFIVIEGILLPIGRVMTFCTIFPQLIFMGIVLLMAVNTTVRDWFIFPFYMAFLAVSLKMFSVQPVSFVIRRIMVKGGWLPIFQNMACLALLILQLTFVNIFVAI